MVLWLTNLLLPFISAVNVFTYVSARAIFAALTAFIIGNFLAPHFIKKMKSLGGAQPIRDDGPQSHLEKPPTPTMGGLFLLTALLLSALLWCDWRSPYLWTMVFVTIAFAAIGGIDDYLKVVKKDSKGISVRVKLLAQCVAAGVVLVLLWQFDLTNGHYAMIVPYIKDTALMFGVGGFFVIGFLAIVGASNAVNLTDGLDGLAILISVLVAGGLSVYTYVTGHAIFAPYLNLPYIPGTHEVGIFCAALVGAGLSFLWYNAHPAEVFMGDVGALAIGAILATVAVIVRQEIVFIIMSGVFVVEALSVMLQVGVFKITGNRVLRMAPIHHHFELKGWNENHVVVRFWIITLVLVLIGLAGIKIR